MTEKYVEQYLVSIYEVSTSTTSYVLVPSNKAFSRLLSNLDSNAYIVMTITPLGNVVNYNDFMKKLVAKNKPPDLNFGDLEGNR